VEAGGIPTLTMTSALDITRAVKPPRAVFVNFPLGHQTGKAGDRELQRAILRDALRAFESIAAPATIIELPYVWDPTDHGWEERDYRPGFMPRVPNREEADRIEAERRARFAVR
jgi:D-proline reductase (dithiol) PrdB